MNDTFYKRCISVVSNLDLTFEQGIAREVVLNMLDLKTKEAADCLKTIYKLQSQIDEVKTAWEELKNSIVDPAIGFTYYEVFEYDFNKLDKIITKLEQNFPIIATSDVSEEVGK